jgi:hypothetical protein
MSTTSDEKTHAANEEPPIPFTDVLLRTPFGALLLATVGSIPAAALTVGVQNWGDLFRRAPWWLLGVTIVVIALGVGVVTAVHPQGRRIATWTFGWLVAAPSALFVGLFTWVFIFQRESVDDWSSWTTAYLFFVVLMVFGLLVVRRRVRDEDDPRLLRSAQAAKGFLIPPEDPTDEILERLDVLSQELRQIRTEREPEAYGTAWNGPACLGRFATRRGWLTPLGTE